MGILVRHETPNTQALRKNAEFFTIFEAAGWTKLFQHFNGFYRETSLQFSLNITKTQSQVKGMQIEVYEVIVVEVTTLPQV